MEDLQRWRTCRGSSTRGQSSRKRCASTLRSRCLSREAVHAEAFQDTEIPKGSLHSCHPLAPAPPPEALGETRPLPARAVPPGISPAAVKFSYVPFSIGPRVCPGMGFGLTEAVLCIATLAQVFQFRLAPNHRVQPVCRMTLRPGDTLPMTLHARSARSGAPVAAEIGNVIAECPVHHLGTG